MSVETSERFLSVDGSGKRVVKMAFDENIEKRNLLVLFKFNGELNVLVSAIEIRKELNRGVLIVKQGESVINISNISMHRYSLEMANGPSKTLGHAKF